MTDTRRAVIAWAVAVIPFWIVLVLCTHWEPVAHDGWGHWMFHRNIGLSADTLYDFAKGTYVHNNPRLGQVLTLLLYTPGPWHEIVTPIVELAMFYLLAALVLGRWPSLRKTNDALLFVTIIAMAAATVPSFGMMLFYRPFTGNYLFGLVINLALLVPYRFHYEAAREHPWWQVPALLVLGFAAGLCNEHTGPALAAVVALAIISYWRRGERRLLWAAAGLLGVVAGGLALFAAPGQSIRYNALATHQSTLARIIDRGFVDNAKIIFVAIACLLPLVVWLGVGVVARLRGGGSPQPAVRRRILFVAAGLSLAITLTLLASPKQGFRLYLASVVIACAATAGWVVSQLAQRWSRAVIAAIAAIVIGYVSWRCTTTYHTLGREFAARVEMLDRAPDHSVADIPTYTVKRSRWSVGDDLLIENIRNHVSAEFRLALVRVHVDQRDAAAVPPSAEEP